MEKLEVALKTSWHELWLTSDRRTKLVYVAHLIFALSFLIFTLSVIIYYKKVDESWQDSSVEAVFGFFLTIAVLAFLYSLHGGWRSFLINIVYLIVGGGTILIVTSLGQTIGSNPDRIFANILVTSLIMAILVAFNIFILDIIRRLLRMQKPARQSIKKQKKSDRNILEEYRNPDFDSFISNPIVEEFVGENFEHYKELWTKDFQQSGDIRKAAFKYHVNWLALLSTCPTWFGYRKMYKASFVCIGVLCFASLFFDYLGWNNSPAIVVINLTFAFTSKSLYLDHAWIFFQKNKGLSQTQLQNLIQEKGGTSIPGSIVMTLFAVLVLGFVSVLGEKL